MPTLRPAAFSSFRRRFLLLNAVENRNAKRSKRASFSNALPLLLMALVFAPTFGFLGCALTPKPKLPEVVGETPTFEELQTAVNANSAKIETFFTSDASLGVASTPGWAKCQIAFERPGNLRLVGSAPTMGRVVDVGCNEERFWFWSDFQNADELYYCRHDQYQNSATAGVLPLDPTWFPEAFGLVELKDDELVDGPTRQDDGSLLVTTKKTRSDGVYLKRLYFEPKTAAILRQDVQAPNGETVVSIRCTRSAYLEEPGVVLPQKLEIACPRANASLLLDVGAPILNDSSKIAAEAFKQPTDLKAKAIDLGVSTAQVAAPAPTPLASNPIPTQQTTAATNESADVNDSNGYNVADASPTSPSQTAATLPDSTLPKVRMFARARVEAVSPAAQTIAAVPTAATAQIPQAAPFSQSRPTAQTAPTFQTPQNALLEAPAPSQIAPTLENFDALLPDDAPALPDDFPFVEDVPAPVGPKSEVVGAPRAAF